MCANAIQHKAGALIALMLLLGQGLPVMAAKTADTEETVPALLTPGQLRDLSNLLISKPEIKVSGVGYALREDGLEQGLRFGIAESYVIKKDVLWDIVENFEEYTASEIQEKLEAGSTLKRYGIIKCGDAVRILLPKGPVEYKGLGKGYYVEATMWKPLGNKTLEYRGEVNMTYTLVGNVPAIIGPALSYEGATGTELEGWNYKYFLTALHRPDNVSVTPPTEPVYADNDTVDDIVERLEELPELGGIGLGIDNSVPFEDLDKNDCIGAWIKVYSNHTVNTSVVEEIKANITLEIQNYTVREVFETLIATELDSELGATMWMVEEPWHVGASHWGYIDDIEYNETEHWMNGTFKEWTLGGYVDVGPIYIQHIFLDRVPLLNGTLDTSTTDYDLKMFPVWSRYRMRYRYRVS